MQSDRHKTGSDIGRLARVAVVALAVIAAAAPLPVMAATAVAAGEAARQALFQRMLADPGNVELALQYAALSEQAGDLEGAVSTLQRLLIFAPTVARLNFELGVLYYRLGAFDAASGYFQTASTAPDATPDLKAQATQYIALAAEGGAADHSYATVAFGARYQTNANGGAGSPLVYLNGVPFTLNAAAMADPDANGFIAANAHMTHDLAAQGDRFNVDLSLYGSLYAKHTELNTGAGEMEFGPVYNLDRFNMAGSTLGLYGIVGAVTLQGTPYLYTAGIGTVLTTATDPATLIHARFEYRYEQYFDSAARPTVDTMSGSRLRATTDVQHQVNDWLSFYGAIYGERKAAVVGMNSDWEAGASVGTVLRFKGLGDGQRPWSLDVSTGLDGRTFDAPDPMVSTSPRTDREAFVQGALTVPVGPDWSAVGTLGYRKQISSYDLYTYDNISTSLAMQRGF